MNIYLVTFKVFHGLQRMDYNVPAIFPILEGPLEHTFWYRLQFVQRILLNFFNAVKTVTTQRQLKLRKKVCW